MVFCNEEGTKSTLLSSHVTILILIDGFLQFKYGRKKNRVIVVTILILIDGFLQCIVAFSMSNSFIVTILILIDGFLQLK